MRINEGDYKKMNKLIFLILLFVTSCSRETIRVQPKQRTVDPTFVPYIQDYSNIINSKQQKHKKFYDRRIKKLYINFAHLNGDIIGRCYWLLNGEFEIEIDQTYWEVTGFLSRRFLIYHELEHCIRLRMHTHEGFYKKRNIMDYLDYLDYFSELVGIVPAKGYFLDGCPNSIMHPNDAGEWCHSQHYNEYIQEMADYKDTRLQ